MKLKIISTAKTEKGSIDLPSQFSEKIRHDIIKRAVLAICANRRQPYGTDPRAGKKAHAKLSRRRRDYKGSYGHGISRVPRKIMSRSGTQFNWTGAFSPNTVGGRRAHPPKAEKIWSQKINRKENRKAIRSALAATLVKEMAKERGHKVPDNYPFVIESKIEGISKSKELLETLGKIGFAEELGRATRKIRAGRGKSRGRKYKSTRGMLIVTSGKCALQKAAGNITGLEITDARSINTEMLAPGTMPGRMTIFTESALEVISREKLFTEERKKPEKALKEEKAAKPKKAVQAKSTPAKKEPAKAGKETKK